MRFTNDSLGPGQAAAKELKAKLAMIRVYRKEKRIPNYGN